MKEKDSAEHMSHQASMVLVCKTSNGNFGPGSVTAMRNSNAHDWKLGLKFCVYWFYKEGRRKLG